MLYLLSLLLLAGIPSTHADTTPNPVVTQLQAQWPIVLTAIRGAQQDDHQLDAAYQQYSTWAAQARPFAELGADLAQGGTELSLALETGSARAYSDCVASHTLGSVAHLIWLGGWLQDKQDLAPYVSTSSLEDRINRCARFKLSFSSDLTAPTHEGPVHAKTTAQVEVTGSLAGGKVLFMGTASLDYATLEWPHPHGDCSLNDVHGISGSLLVKDIELQTVPGAPDTVLGLTLSAVIQPPSESVTFTCTGSGTQTITESAWYAFFMGCHHDEAGPGGWTVRSWQLTPSAASQSYTSAPQGITQDTELQLTLDPR